MSWASVDGYVALMMSQAFVHLTSLEHEMIELRLMLCTGKGPPDIHIVRKHCCDLMHMLDTLKYAMEQAKKSGKPDAA